MDEPMEEGTDNADVNQQVLSNDSSKVPSILKPGSYSMVLMTISPEDYETQYWPKLKAAIDQLLTMTPGEYIPISYEQMYSCVYKCVCKQLSEQLYQDLIDHISAHLQKVTVDIQQLFQTTDALSYIEKFHYVMQQYLTALGGIVPIFNYMNRFYVATKLKTDLNKELRQLFITYVADKHVPNLIPLLVDANAKPFSVSPPVMATLMNNIYSLKPEFAQSRPQLFAKYIPNILPACMERDLPHYAEEARQMTRDLRTNPDFIGGDQSRKRLGDDDIPKSSPMTFLPRGSS